MTDYTVGFMFDEVRDSVVLIEKNRPDWQKGLLNGVGGHINNNEQAREGMVREFLEEAGVQTEVGDWQCFCRLTVTSNPQGDSVAPMVYFFSAFNDVAFNAARSAEDELVVKREVIMLCYLKTIPNLQWLIPLALHHTIKFPVHVIE